ncbi:MAG: hypothetical protein J5958_07065 [Clostridia bacterium]|nr:hypothetical protein [Clostridia bacterium]
MKSRILALLLCLVLIASACLMTACGKKKNTTAETEPAAVEVTDDAARQVALAAFLKGIDAIRKGGVTFTGTLVGSSTEKNEEGALVTDNFDLSLDLKYNAEKFDAVATGTAGSDSGTFEAYFDGSLFAILSTEDGKSDGSVYFIDDFAGFVPGGAMLAGEDDDYTAIFDQILALIDFDKVAANVNAAAKGAVVIKTNGTTYTVSVSSDALFDFEIATLNILKDSGDKTVAELFDALVGEGSFAKLQATLAKFSGTSKVSELIPELEAALTDAGIKVDALYEFLAPYLGVTGEGVVNQVKSMLTGMTSELTIDDAISMVVEKVQQMIGSMFGMGEKQNYPDEYQVAEQYQSAPGGEPATSEEPAPTTGEAGPELNYATIVGMITTYSEMKVNDLIAGLNKVESFDISAETDPVIAEISGLKEAIKFNVTVTCDATLNPTKIDLNATVDSSKLPAEMQEEGESQNFTLTVSAEIKSSVDVAPSTAMQAKIDEVKRERAAAAAPTTEPEN